VPQPRPTGDKPPGYRREWAEVLALPCGYSSSNLSMSARFLVQHPQVQRASQLAVALRREILETDLSNRPSSFERFPRASCGDASLLLHSLLKDAGITGSRIAEASRGIVASNTWTSHAWVELGDVVLDITADQFTDGGGSLYLGLAGTFHRSFTIDGYEFATVDIVDGPSLPALRDFYVRVRSVILRP
jgi:hypothetical protein